MTDSQGPDDASTRMPTEKLTSQMIEKMRSKEGMELEIDGSRNNAEATLYAILRFAEGIGDTNPLWNDTNYARGSVAETLLAPPSWIFCCFAGVQFGFRGLGSVHSSSDLTFFRYVRLGDRVSVRCTYDGFDGPMPSRFAGQKIVERFRVEYSNQEHQPVALHMLYITRFERGEVQSRTSDGKPNIELPHPWTPAELEAIDNEVLDERSRGAQPLWWDDVSVGDKLESVTRGPIGLTDEIAYVAAGAAPIPRVAAHGAALRRYKSQPGWAFRDPSTHAWEPNYSVHYNEYAARQQGALRAYDVGPQRMSWQITMLNNWAGDHGFVKKVSDQFRGFVYLSDVVRLKGEVTEKSIDEDGDAVVTISTSAENQRGQVVMPGYATVALPTREGRNPLDARI